MSDKIARLTVHHVGNPDMSGKKRNVLGVETSTAAYRLFDKLEPFDPGDKVVVILESDYGRMKTLSEAIKALATADPIVTTRTQYETLVRIAAEAGYVVDGNGYVTKVKR